jgi:hypothetical protein
MLPRSAEYLSEGGEHVDDHYFDQDDPGELGNQGHLNRRRPRRPGRGSSLLEFSTVAATIPRRSLMDSASEEAV